VPVADVHAVAGLAVPDDLVGAAGAVAVADVEGVADAVGERVASVAVPVADVEAAAGVAVPEHVVGVAGVPVGEVELVAGAADAAVVDRPGAGAVIGGDGRSRCGGGVRRGRWAGLG